MNDQKDTTKPKRDERAAASALSASPGSIFELVDCTDDEIYFPMGLFLSLEDALAQIKDREEPPTDDPEEFVRMEVRERQIGQLRWWDNGETVAKIEWVEDYIEDEDDLVWRKPAISLTNVDLPPANQPISPEYVSDQVGMPYEAEQG